MISSTDCGGFLDGLKGGERAHSALCYPFRNATGGPKGPQKVHVVFTRPVREHFHRFKNQVLSWNNYFAAECAINV